MVVNVDWFGLHINEMCTLMFSFLHNEKSFIMDGMHAHCPLLIHNGSLNEIAHEDSFAWMVGFWESSMKNSMGHKLETLNRLKYM